MKKKLFQDLKLFFNKIQFAVMNEMPIDENIR